MIDRTPEAEIEHRLPIAYSQGFAHIRVLAFSNPDDVGPLAVPGEREDAEPAGVLADGIFPAAETLVVD